MKGSLSFFISGLPLIIVGLWSFLTYYLQSDTHYSDTSVYPETSGNIDIDVGGLNGTSELIGSLTAVPRIDEVNDYQVVANHSSVSTCPFFGETTNKLVVWAYQAPVLLLLACNMVFLIYIMTVSITKNPHHHTKSFFSPFLFTKKEIFAFSLPMKSCYPPLPFCSSFHFN